MTIKEREEELFQRWKAERSYSPFIEDGIFDESVWRKETRKVTFVLKDPNWPPGKDDNLCRNLMGSPDPKSWRTWDNVARWAKALLEGGAYPERFAPEERRGWLSRVSAINLKKEGGTGQVPDGVIRSYARCDEEYLREQLLLYAPDAIVCCGKAVFMALSQDVLPGRSGDRVPGLPIQDEEEWDAAVCFYTRFPGKERLTPVLGYHHPQQRFSRRENWREWYRQMLEVRALLLPPEL